MAAEGGGQAGQPLAGAPAPPGEAHQPQAQTYFSGQHGQEGWRGQPQGQVFQNMNMALGMGMGLDLQQQHYQAPVAVHNAPYGTIITTPLPSTLLSVTCLHRDRTRREMRRSNARASFTATFPTVPLSLRAHAMEGSYGRYRGEIPPLSLPHSLTHLPPS